MCSLILQQNRNYQAVYKKTMGSGRQKIDLSNDEN